MSAEQEARRLVLSDAEVKRIRAALKLVDGIPSAHNIARQLVTLDDVLALVERLSGVTRMAHDRWLNSERALGQIKEDLNGFGRVLKIALGQEDL